MPATNCITSNSIPTTDKLIERLEQRAGYVVAGLRDDAALQALDELAALPHRTPGGYALALICRLSGHVHKAVR